MLPMSRSTYLYHRLCESGYSDACPRAEILLQALAPRVLMPTQMPTRATLEAVMNLLRSGLRMGKNGRLTVSELTEESAS
jgi:hypothetical protein